MSRKLISTAVAVAVAAMSQTTPLMAQTEERVIEEIITVGTRSQKPRSATDSTVPVDVFSSDDFNSLGNGADITDNLKSLVPSYTATPATGDGSAFIRPTSMRGMAPDQTLVLVNGKRRHRSALVQFFAPAAGNGAHGPDIGMIPGIALKSIEVLRDGAAAQYGSDAIAGVINFQMKDFDEGGSVQVQYGEFYEGESSVMLGANGGFSMGDRGFLNLSIEATDNDALSRGFQRSDAQALIDAGVEGVGSDTPFDDAPLVQTWGRPETSGIRTFANFGFDLSDTAELYAFGNYAETEGRYRFFYRTPNHPSLVPLREQGYTGLQQGYTPFLDGDQTDYSLAGGLRGTMSNEMYYDFSLTYGKNELDYFLNNTINPDLGLVNGEPAQRDFDVGAYEQSELTANADFSIPLADAWNLGFGFEYRDEEYTIVAGEAASYIGAGSNGLAGFPPQDSGSFSRDNYAAYGDLEWDVTDNWLLQGALRYEDYSDFGGTTNGKLATRWNVTDRFTLRGALSTGFHAPTPGQANVRTTITTFDGSTGLQVEEGLVPPTSPIALLNGGAPLKEEESVNASFGLTTDIGNTTTLTADIYQIEVEDRIYRTGDIQTVGGQTISFYTNALEVESRGLDIVLTSAVDWSASIDTIFTFAFNYNEVEVTGQTPVNGINPVSDSIIEDIENNYPNERFVLTANNRFGDNWNFLFRANYYGKHFDERGTIDDPDQPSAEIGATIYVDMELTYDFNDNWAVTLGGQNVFDEYVDEIGPENANRISVGLPYPRRSAANYEGGSWYLRGVYRF